MKNLIKKMAVTISILTAVEFFLSSFFLPDFAVGTLIGGGGAVINLLSLWYDINRAAARGIRPRGFAGRYVFSAVLMLLGGLMGLRVLLGVFVGLLNLKFSAYLVGWRERG